MEPVTPDIRHILCPVDFSDTSAHAIELATAVAAWYRARVTALHVYNPLAFQVVESPLPPVRVPQAEIDRVRKQTTASVEPAKAAGVPVDVVVDVGKPATQILDRAVSMPADLVVMGTHGTSGFEHLVLGSVTESVLRRARCPVLTVPPRAQSSSALPFKRLLCAVDFSDPSLAALALACSIAEESSAALTLIHVLEWPWEEPPPPVFEELPHEQATALSEYRRYVELTATKRLESLAPSVRARCVSSCTVRHGKPYVEVLRAAGEAHVDLIVLGVHGRNVVDMTLFGSTTNQVVRRATCPVLTLRQ